jgi:hypothetical protein
MIFGRSGPDKSAPDNSGSGTRNENSASELPPVSLNAAVADAAAPLRPSTTPEKSAPATAAAERPTASLRYVDRPDLGETFADSVSGLIFDGQTLRIEFAVTRLDEVKTGAPITGRRYPACRVVLPPAAAIDLINRMQQIATALTQAGVVKPVAR